MNRTTNEIVSFPFRWEFVEKEIELVAFPSIREIVAKVPFPHKVWEFDADVLVATTIEIVPFPFRWEFVGKEIEIVPFPSIREIVAKVPFPH